MTAEDEEGGDRFYFERFSNLFVGLGFDLRCSRIPVRLSEEMNETFDRNLEYENRGIFLGKL